MANIVRPGDAPETVGTSYPPPLDAPCRSRRFVRLGLAAGLSQFGVNLCHLPPGAHASLRHWHSHEDEFVLVLSGELVLVDDDGEHPVRAGDAVGHPAGDGNAHHLVNRSDAEASFLAVGSRHAADVCRYPDHGLETTLDRYARRGVYVPLSAATP